jgi:hypothetical protein
MRRCVFQLRLEPSGWDLKLEGVEGGLDKLQVVLQLHAASVVLRSNKKKCAPQLLYQDGMALRVHTRSLTTAMLAGVTNLFSAVGYTICKTLKLNLGINFGPESASRILCSG